MIVVPVRQSTHPGVIGSLESIFGLLKSLKIRALLGGGKGEGRQCLGHFLVIQSVYSTWSPYCVVSPSFINPQPFSFLHENCCACKIFRLLGFKPLSSSPQMCIPCVGTVCRWRKKWDEILIIYKRKKEKKYWSIFLTYFRLFLINYKGINWQMHDMYQYITLFVGIYCTFLWVDWKLKPSQLYETDTNLSEWIISGSFYLCFLFN